MMCQLWPVNWERGRKQEEEKVNFSFYKLYNRDSIHRLNWKASSLAREYLISLVAFILLRPSPNFKRNYQVLD